MLIDQIKTRMMAALKAHNDVEKEILRVAIGEIQTAEARDRKTFTDDEVRAIVRKLVKANEETMSLTTDDAQKRTLAAEITVLKTLLPQSMTVAQIVEALASVREAVRAAGNDGQATGVAMKALKASGAVVDGKDVSAAVRQLRA